MKLTLFSNLGDKDKNKAVEYLIQSSSPHQEFFLMVILSVLMAAFGLLINNASVIIGSMLIAPILYPVLGLSLGITMADFGLITRSFNVLLKSVVLGALSAAVITLLFFGSSAANSEIVSRTAPSLVYFAIAVVAGLGASFALVKPYLSEMLPGVAISVALIPPVAVMGIGLAKFSWEIFSGSFLLLLTNIAGIAFASLVIFSLTDLYPKRKVADKAIKKEDAELRKAEDIAEDLSRK